MLALALLAAIVVLPAAEAGSVEPPWLAHYEAGVRSAEQGRWTAARSRLQLALRLNSEEALRVDISGSRRVDYLPHLFLAIVHHMLGEPGLAKTHLAEAEQTGLAAMSQTGALLLVAYRGLIGEAGPPGRDQRFRLWPHYQTYERQPALLDVAQLQRLRRRVLTRCGMPDSTSAADLPWYYHYQLAVALADAGDDQLAIDALLRAIAQRARPQRHLRTYGMWFLDYLPYSQLVRAHARLGNLSCARDALLLAQRLGELEGRESELAELKALVGHMR